MTEHRGNNQDRNGKDIFGRFEQEFYQIMPALEKFDNSRAEFYGQVAIVATEIETGKYDDGEDMNLSVALVEQSTRELVSAILDGNEDFAMKVDLISDIFKIDAGERRELLQTLIGESKDFGRVIMYEGDDIQGLVLKALQQADSSENDDAATRVTRFFSDDICQDIGTVIEVLLDTHSVQRKIKPATTINEFVMKQTDDNSKARSEIIAENRESLVNKLKEYLGEHAVEISRAAAGLSAALIIDGILRRYSQD